MAKVSPAPAPIDISLASSNHERKHSIETPTHASTPKGSKKPLGWYEGREATAIRKIVRGRYCGAVMMISLFLALFLGELFAVLQIPTNTEQNIILTIVMVLFALELVLLIITDASYFKSFFFFMDLIGTVSMIFDVSYLYGEDATAPNMKEYMGAGSSDSSENVIIVRATRAAKLGARAGRLSRVLKILRFLLPLIGVAEDQPLKNGKKHVKEAKVIANRLTNVLSTRVAFMTILIVVIIPVFSIFLYPVFDDSMVSWTILLNENAQQLSVAKADVAAGKTSSADDLAEVQMMFDSELTRFANFYEGYNYGPFSACVGDWVDNSFSCSDTLSFKSTFVEPDRKASAWLMSYPNFQAGFTLEQSKRNESTLNICLLLFIILMMCAFGLVMSNSISTLALQPLERMLAAVRDKCGQIFKYTAELQEDNDEEYHSEQDQDIEQDSEFVLLEKAVAKLAGIVNLATTSKEPEITANMTEDDKMALSWMQGTQVPAMPRKSMMCSESEAAMIATAEPLDTSVDVTILFRKAVPDNVQRALLTDCWDSTAVEDFNAVPIAAYLVCCGETNAAWVRQNVKDQQMSKFVSICLSKYPPNPFHNFAHGLDCTFSVSRYMRDAQAHEFFTEQQMFWILVAGLGHDLGHPGVNNQYLIETAHELAVKYNDKAPLENMHCSTLFQIMSDPDANLFAQVSRDNFKEIRKGIIAAILHTDMAQHFAMVKELTILYEMNSDDFDALHPHEVVKSSHTNVQMALNAMLHTADVNNPMKPWDLAFKLAHKCVEEFFAQGDLEKAAAIPVGMLNDRDKVNIPQAQIGFVEFLIMPLAEQMVKIFPQLDGLAMNISKNVPQWADIWIAENAPPDEAKAKVQARCLKIAEKCQAVTRSARSITMSPIP